MVAVLACTAAIATGSSVLNRYSLEADSIMQWRLPDRLNEISGLAMTDDGRLFAVDDEVAIVYELDYDEGGIIKAFAMGKPVVKGDFEGIAVADELIYLTTSTGRLYVSAEGADGQRVSFDVYDTGLGAYCEVEGLVQSNDSSILYFMCKKPRKKSDIRGLSLFAWDLAERRMLPERTIILPETEILRKLRLDRLSPSGVTIERKTGNRLIIASRQRVLVEITADGSLVDARHLPLGSRHRQAEGIELAIDGRLLVADEGGSHRARLAVYDPDRSEQEIND